ncbi:larval cuticle protein LCP-30 [Drosophila novamexicana]|uniref:larval cuticle protein LCP-30 n=1 Tax=Drosophila novamexicana TaxID=47314 RepID=UPI0011E5E611|nr:larval cuticle protein LCP-30 [Drosophila novamexicana]
MLLRLTIWLLICAAVALAQNDGRYRPPPTTPSVLRARTNANANAGRYTGASDGRYVAGNDGRYRGGGDGRYRGGNDGRYVHKDVKYQHDNRPGGDYTGDSNPYVADKNKFGAGGGAGRGGGGAGANGARGSGAGAGATTAANKPRPSTSLPRPTPAVDLRPNLPQGRGTGIGKNGFLILRQEGELQADGYNYLYETENGILGEESGRIEKQTEGDALRSKGYYEYTGDDGLLYRVDYVADENGFVPAGEHIPKVPEHIPRLLTYLKEQGAL